MSAGPEDVNIAGGVRLRTTTEGHGPPVVLCHRRAGGVDNLAPVSVMLTDIARFHGP